MSKTPIELKPCPFCGGAGEMHPSALSAFTRMAFVECVDCGCKSMASHYDNPGFILKHIAKAAENWNNRPAETELSEAQKLIEQMHELLILNKQIMACCSFWVYPDKKVVERFNELETALSAAERKTK